VFKRYIQFKKFDKRFNVDNLNVFNWEEFNNNISDRWDFIDEIRLRNYDIKKLSKLPMSYKLSSEYYTFCKVLYVKLDLKEYDRLRKEYELIDNGLEIVKLYENKSKKERFKAFKDYYQTLEVLLEMLSSNDYLKYHEEIYEISTYLIRELTVQKDELSHDIKENIQVEFELAKRRNKGAFTNEN